MNPKLAALGCLLTLLLSAPALQAGRANGETFFERFPTVTRAATDNYSSTYNYARYIFEISIPANSGEALGSLSIGIPRQITIPDPSMVQALDGEGKPIALGAVTIQDNTLQLRFAQPPPPGSRLAVQLYPMRNPRSGGTFLFEISAAPAGPAPRAQFLSFGRISFYQPGGRR